MIVAIREFEERKWVLIRKTCENIGFTKGQMQNNRKLVSEDPMLSSYAKYITYETNGGKQKGLAIDYAVAIIWLSKINTKSLNETILNNLQQAINEVVGIKPTVQPDYYSKQYLYESRLRDEIYDIGEFDNIKILEKEKVYDFGRIDLYGVDSNGNKCCIELKKDSCFCDTKKQLLRYKNSKKFDRVIYCAFNIEDEFISWTKHHNIEVFAYKRELIISKI